jgi:hypothetical protein
MPANIIDLVNLSIIIISLFLEPTDLLAGVQPPSRPSPSWGKEKMEPMGLLVGALIYVQNFLPTDITVTWARNVLPMLVKWVPKSISITLSFQFSLIVKASGAVCMAI